MKIRSAKYHIKQGAKSITKNGLMSFASIASVAACAFMLIISLCIAINLDLALEKVEESIGVSLYLGDEVTEEEIQGIFEKLQSIPNVLGVSYMSKEDALNWAKNEWGDEQDILSGLEDDNPFPRSFEISIDGAKNQKQVIKDVTQLQKDFELQLVDARNKEEEEIKDIIENPLQATTVTKEEQSTQATTVTKEEQSTQDITQNKEATTNISNSTDTEKIANIGDKDYNYIGIEKIRHSQKESDILLAINNTVRIASIIIIIILSAISVAIIVNTIKLTVYVRKTEINIMKYVGATDWFIRWPFVIEGIIIGIIGSIIPIVICVFGYNQSVAIIYENMPFIKNYVEFKDTFSMFLAIAPVTVILGVLLGAIGSVNAIKKHLNV
ncbi:permease-like cell division protein FtsX [uncultured Tyzzerella sp.]|uniref:permease-like cell division protein FtsX n=1 Tax=uncultured Tyzzerella sp. TaxID=2321398 RepID=UPI002943D5ED|nr:permease-like cell division protein FtsX [uncultured Tyzzerella sp.]